MAKTTIDWLKFRVQADPFSILRAVAPGLGTCADLLSLGDVEPGKDGWQHRRVLKLAGDMTIGAIDYGGDSQRGWARADLPGHGCEWLQDLEALRAGLEKLPQIGLRRVDVALTVSDGSITHERVLDAYERGQFTTTGRRPKARVLTSSERTDGRTIYIGSRTGAKFIRAYEKGYELLAKGKIPEGLRSKITGISMDRVGMANIADIYRLEVEFKDVDRPIPLAILTESDSYFAGANEFCGFLLPYAPEVVMKNLPRSRAKLELAKQVEHCRKAYGGLFRAMLQSMTPEEVCEALAADSPSPKLVRAGVLTL